MTVRPKVLYLLYTGDLYGTEQMAITHLRAILDQASVLIVAPDGPIHAAANAMGIPSVKTGSLVEIFAAALRFARSPGPLTILTASLSHSAIGLAAASMVPWKKTRHFNICHGGTDLSRSYGRKRIFNRTPVGLIAVSEYCAALLRRFGVSTDKITIIENFLADERFAKRASRRERVSQRLQVVAVTRLVPVKQVGLLIEALRLRPILADTVSVTIVGAGPLLDELSHAAEGLDVTFLGFRTDIDDILSRSDIFVQTCAIESFGLAVAEAMAAEVMVIAPDQGGAAEIVGDERHGLLYKAQDASSLADAMLRAVTMSHSARLEIASAGAERVRTNYSAASRRQRLTEVLLPR